MKPSESRTVESLEHVVPTQPDMPSTSIAHAGPPTTTHVLTDVTLGVGVGVFVVGVYYLFLRFYVAGNRDRPSSG